VFFIQFVDIFDHDDRIGILRQDMARVDVKGIPADAARWKFGDESNAFTGFARTRPTASGTEICSVGSDGKSVNL
jgi:hypothetical protein